MSDSNTILHLQRFDDLDVRIFRELGSPSSLQWNVRETYSGIARRIGVDEETVRRRVKRAEKLGSVTGWRMMLNPHTIGCEACGMDVEVKDEQRKDRTIEEIRRVDGVVKILNFRGRALQVTLYYLGDDALKRKTELLTSLCGSEPTVWKIEFPRSRTGLTVTDWKIIQAMLEDARKSLQAVSETMGVSVRTITRRLTYLTQERAVYLQGTPNFSNFAGLSCVFLVFCPYAEKKETVDDLVLFKVPRIELSNTNSKQHSTFVTVFDNLSQADDFAKWIEGFDGVRRVKLGIMKDLIVVQDWLKDEIGRRVAGRGELLQEHDR